MWQVVAAADALPSSIVHMRRKKGIMQRVFFRLTCVYLVIIQNAIMLVDCLLMLPCDRRATLVYIGLEEDWRAWDFGLRVVGAPHVCRGVSDEVGRNHFCVSQISGDCL